MQFTDTFSLLWNYRKLYLYMLVLSLLVFTAILVVPSLYFVALLGITVLCFIYIWLFVRGHDFQVLFVTLFLIGYFQSFSDKLSIVFKFLPSPSLWGPLKYAIMFLMLCGYCLRMLLGKVPALNTGVKIWLLAWFLNLFMFIALILEAKNSMPDFNPISTIQSFGIGNMFLVLIVYIYTKPNDVVVFLKILVWAGIIAALFGVAQRIAGPPVLAAIGIDIFDPKTFAFLDTLDRTAEYGGGFRVFSFFASHHAFSGFLIFSTISLKILHINGQVKKGFYNVALVLLWSGFAVTYNLTNILTCILVLLFFSYLAESERLSVIYKILLKKKFWKLLLFYGFVASISILSIESLRNRFFSIFVVSTQTAGAGGSLYSRILFILNGLNALVNNPMGLGLNLAGTGSIKTTVTGYARTDFFTLNNLDFSGDSWFLWLLVQVGILGFGFYLFLFLHPVIWGWRKRAFIYNSNLRAIFLGILALVTVTVVAGVSNSPILCFTPTNTLIWAAVGVLYKIPVWDMHLRERTN